MEQELLTVNQAAKKFNVHPQTIRNWYRDGVLPAYRPNPKGKVFLRLEDVDKVLANRVNGDNGKKV